jgi:hypothetical protein
MGASHTQRRGLAPLSWGLADATVAQVSELVFIPPVVVAVVLLLVALRGVGTFD